MAKQTGQTAKTAAIATMLACMLFCFNTGQAQSVWTGPKINFSKQAFADWTLPENQDRITDNVWLTRADLMGVFNIAVDSSYMGPSPTDTVGDRLRARLCDLGFLNLG